MVSRLCRKAIDCGNVSVNGKSVVEISFPHISLSGDLSHFTFNYEPVFGATYRAGRGFDYGGIRYTNMRLGIYPKQLITNRKHLVL